MENGKQKFSRLSKILMLKIGLSKIFGQQFGPFLLKIPLRSEIKPRSELRRPKLSRTLIKPKCS